MASIIERKGHYCVVYSFIDENGQKKQKWETYKSAADAKRRRKEVEYRQEIGKFVVPQCKTMEDLLREYVSLYGKKHMGNIYLSKQCFIDR